VFAPVPGERRWRRVLLADGNIGIGGDPQRLLRRCRQLSHTNGQILVELDPPGTPTWIGRIRVAVGDGAPSAPFPWAYVSITGLARLAHDAGLCILESWTEAGRWFATLARR
jgi:hypothetical protein